MGHLQPVDKSKAELTPGVYGKTFRLYMDGTADIQEGDRLKDESTGTFYTIVSGGISRRNFGSFDFLHVVIEQTK